MRVLAAAVSKISSNAAVAESCRGRLESGLSRNRRVGVLSELEAELSREVVRATTEDLTMDDERMSREKVKVDGGICR